jgi:hypothetical protein
MLSTPPERTSDRITLIPEDTKILPDRLDGFVKQDRVSVDTAIWGILFCRRMYETRRLSAIA